MTFWERYLLPCRLADVEFPIVELGDQEQLGVRAHEYPFRPGADLEHVGRGAARFRLVGAFFRRLEGYDERLYPERFEALRARLRTNPITELTHPSLGILDVGVESMDASMDPERRDGQFLTLTIVEKGHASEIGRGAPRPFPDDLPTALRRHAVVEPLVDDDPPFDFLTEIEALLHLAESNPVTRTLQEIDTLSQRLDAIRAGADDLGTIYSPDARLSDLRSAERRRGATRLLDDLTRYRGTLSQQGDDAIKYTLPADTDLWRLAMDLYGDGARAEEIEAMNPDLDGLFLPRGTTLVVPRPDGYPRGAS